MTFNTVTIGSLADQENERLKSCIQRYMPLYALANDTISLVSTGITGYRASCRAFGQYHSQIVISLSLALLSALRLHKTQVYSNLRLALEHTALAAYALAKPNDEYFKANYDTAAHDRFMKKKVYPWLGSKYGDASAEIQRIKGLINEDHAHANIVQAKRNLKPLDGDDFGVEVDFFDPQNDQSIMADLFHVHYVGMLSLVLVIAVNNDDPSVRAAPHFGDEYRRLGALGLDMAPPDGEDFPPVRDVRPKSQ